MLQVDFSWMIPTSYNERNYQMFRRHQISIFIVIVLSFQFLACTTHDIQRTTSIPSEDVVLFYPGKAGNGMDVITFKKIAQELGLSTRVVDHRLINDRKAFFHKNGERKFQVFSLPGGEPYSWFEKKSGKGIDCAGVKNILEFIGSGGSLIAMCVCSPSMHQSPDKLTQEMVEDYLLYLKNDKGNTPGTCGTVVAGLRFFYNHVSERQVPINGRFRKKRVKLPTVLPQEEIWRIINARENLKHRLLLMTTYSAGLRAFEVAALNPEHINS
jgi:hypothetical protein